MARETALQREKRKNKDLELQIKHEKEWGNVVIQENNSLRDRINFLYMTAEQLGKELVAARLHGDGSRPLPPGNLGAPNPMVTFLDRKLT